VVHERMNDDAYAFTDRLFMALVVTFAMIASAAHMIGLC
jgi:hypothetical protein